MSRIDVRWKPCFMKSSRAASSIVSLRFSIAALLSLGIKKTNDRIFIQARLDCQLQISGCFLTEQFEPRCRTPAEVSVRRPKLAGIAGALPLPSVSREDI